MLSRDIYNSIIYFPKIYLFVNRNIWYVFANSSTNIHSFTPSQNITAIKGGSANQFQFLMMYTEGCTIVMEFNSEGAKLPSQYLIDPAGGSYPILHVSERWEAFPQEVIKTFHNLALADERRNAFQNVFSLKKSDPLSTQQLQLHLRSTRFWLPNKLFLSFLPEGFSIETDCDAIRSISLPDSHKTLGHIHHEDKNLTIFLACATDSMYQKKQFYFIFTCKLHNYFIAAGVFLSGVAIQQIPSSSSMMFFFWGGPLAVALVHLLIEHKDLVLESLQMMLANYGNFGFEAVSTYEDITR